MTEDHSERPHKSGFKQKITGLFKKTEQPIPLPKSFPPNPVTADDIVFSSSDPTDDEVARARLKPFGPAELDRFDFKQVVTDRLDVLSEGAAKIVVIDEKERFVVANWSDAEGEEYIRQYYSIDPSAVLTQITPWASCIIKPDSINISKGTGNNNESVKISGGKLTYNSKDEAGGKPSTHFMIAYEKNKLSGFRDWMNPETVPQELNDEEYTATLYDDKGNPFQRIIFPKAQDIGMISQDLDLDKLKRDPLQPPHGIPGKSWGDDRWRETDFSKALKIRHTT